MARSIHATLATPLTGYEKRHVCRAQSSILVVTLSWLNLNVKVLGKSSWSQDQTMQSTDWKVKLKSRKPVTAPQLENKLGLETVSK